MDHKIGSRRSQWTQELFHQRIIFAEGQALMAEMQEDTDIGGAESLRIGAIYPIYKKIGGVSIETGTIQLEICALGDILALLNDFLVPLKNEGFEPLQNFPALQRWAKHFHWEEPDGEQCEGYILNREMVRKGSDAKGSYLMFKYKALGSDTFTLHKIWFVSARRSYFLLMQKTF